jgi:hypothetical protein
MEPDGVSLTITPTTRISICSKQSRPPLLSLPKYTPISIQFVTDSYCILFGPRGDEYFARDFTHCAEGFSSESIRCHTFQISETGKLGSVMLFGHVAPISQTNAASVVPHLHDTLTCLAVLFPLLYTLTSIFRSPSSINLMSTEVALASRAFLPL